MKRTAAAVLCSLLLTTLSWAFAQEIDAPAPTPGSALSTVPAEVVPTAQATFAPPPRPAPALSLTDNSRAELELYFNAIEQGQIGVLRLFGAEIESVRARWMNTLIDFYPIEGDGFYALLSVNMEQRAANYDLAVFISYTDGTRGVINTTVAVITGGFIRESFTIPPDRAVLLDPEIERSEIARLESIFSSYNTERRWAAGGFQMPINANLTSPFGSFRIFNEVLQTRHTGWDIRAAMGTPVYAMADGVVAFTGLLEIRGNHVDIDHGYGVYSTYSHLSEVHVTRGQEVVKGQVIGVSGDTGRSGGPHFHWEVIVNGNWVDASQFMQTWIP